MDSYNLKTASTYINNLLLARGLLRNGTPIEFAHPSRGEGGKEATMAQIINLVHDLILKRDRDQEYRESSADTLRSLRAESTRQTAALEKQHNRNADLSRQLSLAQAQEQSARKALHTAESSARKLRAEMQRLKTTVDQVRTSCTNDVRKRDKEIARLKSHLTSQQRGNKTGLVGASITINPGSTGLGAATGHARDESPNVDDPEYSLKQETTEFLTQLSQSLSDENDNLIGLVRSALVTLRELQGMPEVNRKQDADDASVAGDEQDDTQQDMLHTLPTDYETLADDMDTVLDNLKNLLTNPNFVAVDEVEMREEEIHRLRAGWEKMEARLRESFLLMDSWRKRMTNGDTIDLEELRMGLGFGEGFETVDREGFSVIDEESEAEEAASSALEEDVDNTEEQEEAVYLPSPKPHARPDKTTGPDVFSIKLQPSQPALRETNGNKSPSRSPRKVAFSASIPNTPSQVDGENADTSGIGLVDAEKASRPTSAAKPPRSEERASRPTSQDRPRHTKKRLSSPRAHPDERSPKLSVQDKLREAAEAAAVTDGDISTNKTDESTEVSEENPKKRTPRSPVKTRISGRPKRRKSTLTPEELANLLGC
ncbi:hypothetical protein J4E86_004638 [Alternaria arbusti]|uniref:uncharacterized protein n=1 Tax=Alternaria arbusti TaxID=232088 RepID=UPI00221FF30C|nr:uncharacterized protein J4E86_004638 [Alternaria arbusti]KAI4957500.1 hypothetical protein J4E86_004638 [Alternaria arbusti]